MAKSKDKDKGKNEDATAKSAIADLHAKYRTGGRDAMLARTRRFVARYEVARGKGFRLADVDPAEVPDHLSERKPESRAMLAAGVEWLAGLQDKLYAQDRRSLLLVFQAMDAAGKDGTIKHVMSGVNPQGVQVSSFKVPSAEELDHDYMWRSGLGLKPDTWCLWPSPWVTHWTGGLQGYMCVSHPQPVTGLHHAAPRN